MQHTAAPGEELLLHKQLQHNNTSLVVLVSPTFRAQPIVWMKADLGVQVVVPKDVHWLSVQQHLALLRLVEVFQQTHAGALPTA